MAWLNRGLADAQIALTWLVARPARAALGHQDKGQETNQDKDTGMQIPLEIAAATVPSHKASQEAPPR